MGRTRSGERELCLPPDLPSDILHEILSKLPVKSLLRFRSVSTSWLGIIHDPKFLKSYRNTPASQICCLRLESGHFKLSLRCSETFRVIADAEHCLATKIPRETHLIGCVDGLFLFVTTKLFLPYRLLLYNPSIRTVRVLPETPKEGLIWRTRGIGFGFDPWIKDYKHVRVASSPDYPYRTGSVMIYTVGTNSWKTIPFKTKSGKPMRFHKYHEPRFMSGTACFRGVLYLIAKTYEVVDTTMVSFDLNTEEFSSAKLPIQRYCDWHMKCASDGSRLALFAFTQGEGGWMWFAHGEGGDVTWTKHYTFSFSVGGVLSVNLDTTGEEASEMLLLRLETDVTLYNLNKNKSMFSVPRPDNDSRLLCATSYVESMMLFN